MTLNALLCSVFQIHYLPKSFLYCSESMQLYHIFVNFSTEKFGESSCGTGYSRTADGSSFRFVFALRTSLNRNGEQLSCALDQLLFNGCQPLLRQIEGRMTGEFEVHHSPQLCFLLCTHYLFTHILIGNRVQSGGINPYRYYPECLRSFS